MILHHSTNNKGLLSSFERIWLFLNIRYAEMGTDNKDQEDVRASIRTVEHVQTRLNKFYRSFRPACKYEKSKRYNRLPNRIKFHSNSNNLYFK